jgi:ectoine hydroxylase-related dioxygenase (phytanoyl-CoA dioxygenase family)
MTGWNLTGLERSGFALVPAVISEMERAEVAEAVAALGANDTRFHAARHLLARCEAVHRLAVASPLADLAREVLGEAALPVKATWFDKNPAANWRVAWHQDRTLAVRERRETPGFSCWTVKDGEPHVQPPCAILEQMVALRLHLDDCPAQNGALRVLPGSHREGILSAAEIRFWVERVPAVTVEAEAGDVLLMRPLLLHASSSATAPNRRRVLHVEYASAPLPGGLEWPLGVA